MESIKLIKNILISFFLLVIIVGWDVAHSENPVVSANEVVTIVATPTPTTKPIVVTHTPIPTALPNKEIADIIKEVFKEDSDKAFKLLSCENASLNPKAINTAGNKPKGSKDVGVFQINEYWQGVNSKFLLDPEINTRIAYKIFEDNGNSFERWTCGRKLGI